MADARELIDLRLLEMSRGEVDVYVESDGTAAAISDYDNGKKNYRRSSWQTHGKTTSVPPRELSKNSEREFQQIGRIPAKVKCDCKL